MIRLAAGIQPTVGETRGHLNFGGHGTVDVGYRFWPHLALMAEGSYFGFGLNSKVLAENDVPGGLARVWSFGVEPLWRARRYGSSWYALAGASFDDRIVDFTQPTIASTFIFDPWFGYFGPVLVPANTVIGSFHSHALGLNAGLGYEWRLHSHFHRQPATYVFIEARFHYANTRGTATDFIPISVGVRF
jgi:hypothetical protein